MQQRKPDIIKQPIPLILGTFAVAVALLVARAVRAPLPCEAEVAGVLSSVGVWFDGLFSPLWSVVFAVFMTVGSAVVFTRIISRYSISVIRSFIPLVLYCLLVCGVSYPVGSPSLGLALFLLAHSAEMMIVSFKRCTRFDDVMCASFYAGLAALLVPDMLYASLLVVFQWAIYRRSTREMVAGAILFLLPLLPASFCFWVAGHEAVWLLHEWCNTLSGFNVPSLAELYDACGGLWGAIVGGAILLMAVASLVTLFGSFGTMRIRARKIHACFLMTFFVGAAMLACGMPLVATLPVIGIGLTPLVHTFFVRCSGVTGTIIYLALLVASACCALL